MVWYHFLICLKIVKQMQNSKTQHIITLHHITLINFSEKHSIRFLKSYIGLLWPYNVITYSECIIGSCGKTTKCSHLCHNFILGNLSWVNVSTEKNNRQKDGHDSSTIFNNRKLQTLKTLTNVGITSNSGTAHVSLKGAV